MDPWSPRRPVVDLRLITALPALHAAASYPLQRDESTQFVGEVLHRARAMPIVRTILVPYLSTGRSLSGVLVESSTKRSL